MLFQGFGVYLVPLMCGARAIAFPRLNAFSYYIYLAEVCSYGFGLFLQYWSRCRLVFLHSTFGSSVQSGKARRLLGPDDHVHRSLGTWFCHLPATTILRYRAPGMTLNRMPILLWEKLVLSIMVMFAMPAVMVVSSLLLLDRLIGTQFFNPAEGGDVLLYQHLFWFFGHPEVYIIFLPGAAIMSTIIPVFLRRHIFGYTPMVVSVVATGFIGFGVWVHHMFATGLPQLAKASSRLRA